jgi:2-iminoacetate synthase
MVGPPAISVLHIEPTSRSAYVSNSEYPLVDEEFKKLVAILRHSVPYVGIIMSTR